MNRPTRRKIAFIGGGGVRTPLIVFGVNEAAEHLGAEELVLFDPDRDRVRIMAELGRAIVTSEGGNLRVREAASLEDAVDGAAFGSLTKIASGGVYVSLAMAERFARSLQEPADALPHQRLSDREFDVFRRIVGGQSITEIANELCVSVKTISTHKTRILEKMQMPHENGLVRYAIRHKLFDDENDI